MDSSTLKKLYIVLGALITALAVVAVLLAVGIGGSKKPQTDIPADVSSDVTSAREAPVTAPPETEPPKPEFQDITLSFVGDCMLASEDGRGAIYFNGFAETADQSYFFSKVLEYFENDDFTIANCENVFTDKQLAKTGKNHTPAYWYKSKTANAGIFKVGCVDVLSVANNHTYDYGEQGALDTKEALENAGLLWGDDERPLVLEKYGIKIGLYLCTMYSEWQANRICDWIKESSETTDYQIVYYHGGTEHQFEPDEWRVRASRKMVDAGADLVIGAHPHVLQPMEEYNGAVIIYSLGNFLFGGARTTTDPFATNRTVIYQQVLRVKDGGISETGYNLIPCYQYKDASLLWQPLPIDPEENYDDYKKVLDFMNGDCSSPK